MHIKNFTFISVINHFDCTLQLSCTLDHHVNASQYKKVKLQNLLTVVNEAYV